MKTQIGDSLSERRQLLEVVNAATPVLEEEIGPPAERVTASWELQSDEFGRILIRLRLSDPFGQASALFSPDELQFPDRSRRRFYRLWGDLLQEASHRQIQILETLETE